MRTPVRYGWVVEPTEMRATPGSHNGAEPWAPTMDVVETESEWVLEVDVPGVLPDRVELTFERGELRIAGERPALEGSAVRRERPAGRFVRTVRLTGPLAPDRIRATSHHGVLRIEVPKAESARPRRIPVTGEAGSAA